MHNLRPARETCETCHWPQKYSEDRLKVFPKFAEDETNTLTKTVMLLKIGGGNKGMGIHGTHLGPGIKIRYAPADEARQTINWVEYNNANDKRKTLYLAAGRQSGSGRRRAARDGLHGLPQPPVALLRTARARRG